MHTLSRHPGGQPIFFRASDTSHDNHVTNHPLLAGNVGQIAIFSSISSLELIAYANLTRPGVPLLTNPLLGIACFLAPPSSHVSAINSQLFPDLALRLNIMPCSLPVVR